MKTIEEIEQLAENNYPLELWSEEESLIRRLAFKKGYTKCQEDMTEKKYTEEDLHTILKLRKEWYSHTDKNVVRDFINSLNKQD